MADPKTMAGVGHLKRVCKDACRVAGAVQETCSSEILGGPERGCILEHQIFMFAEVILRDRCSTSYDLASLFRGRRSTLETWTGKIAKWQLFRLFSLVGQWSLFTPRFVPLLLSSLGGEIGMLYGALAAMLLVSCLL